MISIGDSIAVRVSADQVALAIVSLVHDDGSADGMVYPAGGAPALFTGQAVQSVASNTVGSAWFPATDLT